MKKSFQKVLKVKVSPFFKDVLHCLFKDDKSSFSSIICTSDGHILGQKYDDVGYNYHLCTKTDLDKNIFGVAEVAGLKKEEIEEILQLY